MSGRVRVRGVCIDRSRRSTQMAWQIQRYNKCGVNELHSLSCWHSLQMPVQYGVVLSSNENNSSVNNGHWRHRHHASFCLKELSNTIHILYISRSLEHKARS